MNVLLSERSARLAAVPSETRPRCKACTMLRVYDTATGPTWRCEVCLRYDDGKPKQLVSEALF